MKAVVWHGVGDVRLDEVPDPTMQDPTDAIVEITTSAICGTDLHFVRGTMTGMVEGTVLGHEALGVVREVGPGVRNLRPGDRVVIPSTIGCGACSYCRAGYYAQCDRANPNGPAAGTCFFGGPQTTGPVDGLQAQYARVPFANIGPVWLPEEVTDEQAIMLSDIYPTAGSAAVSPRSGRATRCSCWAPARSASSPITSAYQQGAGRVLCVDGVPSRLEQARARGAEVDRLQPRGPGRGRAGAHRRHRRRPGGRRRRRRRPAPEARPGRRAGRAAGRRFEQERSQVAPEQHPRATRGSPATLRASRCSGRCRPSPRPARSASSASTRRR